MSMKGETATISVGGTPIAEVTNISGPNITTPAVDRTHLTSTWRRKRPGIPDGGDVSFSVLFSRASHGTFLSKVTAPVVEAWVIEWSDGSTATFDAFVSAFTPNNDMDAEVTADVTLTIDDEVVFAAGV